LIYHLLKKHSFKNCERFMFFLYIFHPQSPPFPSHPLSSKLQTKSKWVNHSLNKSSHTLKLIWKSKLAKRATNSLSEIVRIEMLTCALIFLLNAHEIVRIEIVSNNPNLRAHDSFWVRIVAKYDFDIKSW